MADDPRGQHAAAAATIDEQVALIDVAPRQNLVDARHQVVVVLVGVRVLDRVAELAAVPGAAAGIDEDARIAG